MSAWRRYAQEAFPEIDDNDLSSSFAVFFWLLPRVVDAHRVGDDAFLLRGYRFAQWALHQRAGSSLWNAAAVGFYEHLFDNWSVAQAVVPWLDPAARRDVWTLWEDRLTPSQLLQLRRLFDAPPTSERWRELRPRNATLGRPADKGDPTNSSELAVVPQGIDCRGRYR